GSSPVLSPPSSPTGGPAGSVPALSNSDSGNRPGKVVIPPPVALLGNDTNGSTVGRIGNPSPSSRVTPPPPPRLSPPPDNQPDNNTPLVPQANSGPSPAPSTQGSTVSAPRLTSAGNPREGSAASVGVPIPTARSPLVASALSGGPRTGSTPPQVESYDE